MNPEVSAAILQMLRDARALVYRDAESFDQAAAVLEHVGQLLAGEVRKGLGEYESELLGLAGQAPDTNARELRELFRTVKDARNDSVHSGDYIRHHVIRLVELFLILEEAISVNGRKASDLMVRNPLTAELWHNIATVRRAMLTNSFSYLPIRVNGAWKLISDRWIVQHLRDVSGRVRRRQLGMSLEEVLSGNASSELAIAPWAYPNTSIDELRARITELPILIVDPQQNLLGILTAFDLL